ncbi:MULTISPECIES: hypothetical protein [unclassified Paenibacillus]|uniref:hypothetical protein n=1 Tax=unclassified Paenibacillus TaxID=185978 RepID=UPI003832539A
MARSFERKVRKNTAHLNKSRKKQGIQTISGAGSAMDIFRGRNITVPIMLAGLAVLYMLMSYFLTKTGMRGMDWLVFGLYLMLAVIFFIRRPYLKVGKSTLYMLKGGRERPMTAEDMKAIKIEKGYVTVERKGKGGNFIFTKSLGRYDTDAIAERLEKFALSNQVQVGKK